MSLNKQKQIHKSTCWIWSRPIVINTVYGKHIWPQASTVVVLSTKSLPWRPEICVARKAEASADLKPQ